MRGEERVSAPERVSPLLTRFSAGAGAEAHFRHGTLNPARRRRDAEVAQKCRFSVTLCLCGRCFRKRLRYKDFARQFLPAAKLWVCAAHGVHLGRRDRPDLLGVARLVLEVKLLPQQGQVDQAVGFAVENIAVCISTLRHLVRNPNSRSLVLIAPRFTKMLEIDPSVPVSFFPLVENRHHSLLNDFVFQRCDA